MSISEFNRRDRDRMNWNCIAALSSSRTVEHAEQIAAHLNEQDRIKELEELAAATTPITGLVTHHLRTEWQKRQIELNTQKAQLHINKLLVWFLGYGAKARIMENLTNAIKTATHKREMKVNIVSFDSEDMVFSDEEDASTFLKIDWVVKKTNFLTQLKNCFGENFNIRRTVSTSNDEERLIITLVLEFWP